MIAARRLTMDYGSLTAAIRDVNIDIAEGSFVSIVGPSGCGKSTFLRLIAGLREATSGELLIRDQSPEECSLRRAFVFQDPSLLPWRTVADNVMLPFELSRDLTTDAAARRKRVQEALSLVGLLDVDANKLPRELSGGMRMRVSLARAFVTEPQIMLLDEPFAALDDILRQQLNEELQRIWWQRRWTGLFVTHNVSEAVFLSQRVLVMSRRPGRFVADITMPFDYPRRPELRAQGDFASLAGEVSHHLRQAAGVS